MVSASFEGEVEIDCAQSNYDPQGLELAHQMAQLWSSFARHGAPQAAVNHSTTPREGDAAGGERVVEWPRWEASQQKVLHLGTAREGGLRESVGKEKAAECRVWDEWEGLQVEGLHAVPLG